MVCQSCSAEIGRDVRFCPKCGAPAAYAQASSQPPLASGYAQGYSQQLRPRLRVTRNLQATGILWCLFGAYRVIAGLIGMFFLQAWATRGFGSGSWPFGGHMGPQFPEAWVSVLVPVVATYTIVSASLAFVTGYGLLTRRSWGRTLAIVTAILALFKPLLGTALGVYTLWVFVPGESGAEYDAIAAQTVSV